MRTVHVQDDLDRDGGRTAEGLISSHGRVEELLFFATQIQDYPLLISHHIQRQEWQQALEVMCRQRDEETFYKYSPVSASPCCNPTQSHGLAEGADAPRGSPDCGSMAQIHRAGATQAHPSYDAI